MASSAPDYLAILQTLADHRVEFIVIGGVCAVLHGAPVTTFDLDLVQSRTPENLDRLVAALQAMGAYYRGQGDRRLQPTPSFLASPGHHLLMTRFGPLDVLGTIARERTYDDLLPHSVELQLQIGLCVRILDLETLITTKEETGRDKDKAVLPVLRRTLEERRQS
jgi:predicted nucleotidyltransferase